VSGAQGCWRKYVKVWANKSVSRFLLVSLNIEAILQETTLHRRREKLSTMTSGLGLGHAYDATIGRIKGQKGDRARLGMAALMWISHSERPLSVDEICHALAVEIGSTDFNTNNVPSIRTVLSSCQGLATVDEGSSTIRLIHFTLKEHLSRRAHLFHKAHSKIAETCLTYLNFPEIKDLSTSHSFDSRGKPFLRYSSLYWGTHMRMELSDRSRYLALDLLDKYDNHISARLLWKSIFARHHNPSEPFSALHCVSYFGIAGVAIDLIRIKGCDVNKRDSAGLTPLIWAAKYGREEVVKLLLQQKHTLPDIQDTRHGRTALSWAAGNGNEGVVGLFLGLPFVNRGGIGRMWRRVARVLGLLFGGKYINPNKPDNHGRTPLMWAAWNGRDGAVKLLLRREDITPDKPDDNGRTPLMWAAGNGHDGVLKRLLKREDVSPDRPDNNGLTPLSWAAANGRDEVVKLLLERGGVSPDRSDSNGRTPLSWAAMYGRYDVVKLLLEREDVTPDRPGDDGRTPLSQAIQGGHFEVARLLRARRAATPSAM